MDATIGTLDTRVAAPASRLLSRAFADDPIITHYLHDPVGRAIAFPAFFEGVLYELFPSKQVFGAWVDDVGVEPALQGHGIGRQLLAPVLNIADETTTLCYLETPFPRTHAFYENLGFARPAEHNTFAGAPVGVVSFVRPPRS